MLPSAQNLEGVRGIFVRGVFQVGSSRRCAGSPSAALLPGVQSRFILKLRRSSLTAALFRNVLMVSWHV